MKTIVLISCGSQKLKKKAKAQDLYTSPLFRKSLTYASSLNPDKIFILSAKHHLLPLTKTVRPYDQSLNDMTPAKIEEWAEKVIDDLKKESKLGKDRFIILAGASYAKYLNKHLPKAETPLKRKRIGERLKWLTVKTRNYDNCERIHEVFDSLPKYRFPFKDYSLPKNGIYLLYEKGESAHQTMRIVRVGTHNGNGLLTSRLTEHFLTENKDRSIFRKNIGRAILNKRRDPLLEYWEKDLTKKAEREKYQNPEDEKRRKEFERVVTKYIQSKFSIAVIEVESEKERLELESKIISSVSRCTTCHPSEKWLGRYSTVENIRKSGLWLKQGLWKTPLSDKNVKRLELLVGKTIRNTKRNARG